MNEYATKTDSELIDLFKRGNSAAFDYLVLRYQQKIFSLAYFYLQNSTDAEDAAQIVFIKIFKYIGSYRGEAKFSTWLYKIAVNTLKNIVNSNKFKVRRKMTSIDKNVSQDDETYSMELPDERLSPKRYLVRKEKAAFADKILQSLDADKRELMELRIRHGCSYNELAELFDVNLGTIKSRLSRIKNELWNRFGKERHDEMS